MSFTEDEVDFILEIFSKLNMCPADQNAPKIVGLVHSITKKMKEQEKEVKDGL